MLEIHCLVQSCNSWLLLEEVLFELSFQTPRRGEGTDQGCILIKRHRFDTDLTVTKQVKKQKLRQKMTE